MKQKKKAEILKELLEANEKIALLENKLKNKNQLLLDTKEVLNTCVEVVNYKNALLKEASDWLEELLDRADNIGELMTLIKKIQ